MPLLGVDILNLFKSKLLLRPCRWGLGGGKGGGSFLLIDAGKLVCNGIDGNDGGAPPITCVSASKQTPLDNPPILGSLCGGGGSAPIFLAGSFFACGLCIARKSLFCNESRWWPLVFAELEVIAADEELVPIFTTPETIAFDCGTECIRICCLESTASISNERLSDLRCSSKVAISDGPIVIISNI